MMNAQVDRSSTLVWTKMLLDKAMRLTRDSETETELLIMGGNLTAITLASILQERGHDVTLMLDKELFLEKIKNQYLLFPASATPSYSDLVKKVGVEQTILYHEAIQEAAYFLKYQIERLEIECLLRMQDVYVLAETPDDQRRMETEILSMEEVGIPVEQTIIEATENSTQKMKSGYILRDQLQFCPSRYITSFLDHFCSYGGHVIEERKMKDLNFSNPMEIYDEDHNKIRVQKIIFTDPHPLQEAEENTRFSLGRDFFKNLEHVADRHSTADSLPAIGRLNHLNPNLFLATGYDEDDISHSMISALLLTSLIRELPTKYRALFNPYRFTQIE